MLPDPSEWSDVTSWSNIAPDDAGDPATALEPFEDVLTSERELLQSRDVLSARAAATPESTAVIDADTGLRVDYGTLDARVDRRVEALRTAFEESVDRIAILAGTSPAFAETYFAIGRLGATPVALNAELDADTIATQARRADVAGIVCGADTAELATPVAPDDVPVVEMSDDPASTGDRSDAEDRESAIPPLDGDRLILFTSGTTGKPKGVRLTRRNLLASAVGSAARLGVKPGDRWLVCLPTYHMGGLAPFVRSALYGTAVVVQRQFDAEATADALSAFDTTGVSLVPTMLTRLLDAGWSPSPSLRFVLLGGAPASASLVARSLDNDVPVYPTYGTTETASQIATATPAAVAADPETVGRPLSTAAVDVVSDGSACDPGERGEVIVTGPVVSPGYLDAEQTVAAFDDAWFHTGDVGWLDGDGRLEIVGRVDDRIHTGGENVHPARVADAIRAIEGVEDATVVGVPDSEWGERVAALIVADDWRAERIQERLSDSLASYEIPKTIAFAETFPRTASGTVDRNAVRERLSGE